MRLAQVLRISSVHLPRPRLPESRLDSRSNPNQHEIRSEHDYSKSIDLDTWHLFCITIVNRPYRGSDWTKALIIHNNRRKEYVPTGLGYKTHAIDGDIGEVSDFILNTSTWTIGFVALDTRRWLPGKKVLLPISWASGISWTDRSFHVDVPQQSIKTAPEIEEPLSVEAIKAYYAHFGRQV